MYIDLIKLRKLYMTFNYPPLQDASYDQLRKLMNDTVLPLKIKNVDSLNFIIGRLNDLEDQEKRPIKWMKKYVLFHFPGLRRLPSSIAAYKDNEEVSYEKAIEVRKMLAKELGIQEDEIKLPYSKEEILMQKKKILQTFYYQLEVEKGNIGITAIERMKPMGL